MDNYLGDNIVAINFETAPLPVFKEVKGKDYVYYGEDNKYHEFLLRLYDNSAKHGAIVDNKVKYILGNGLKALTPSPLADEWVKKVNRTGEGLNKLLKKASKDIELFGGAPIQVIWGQYSSAAKPVLAEIYHLPFQKIRASQDLKTFFYKKSWAGASRDPMLTFPAFDLSNPTGTQILYYTEYRPGSEVYPKPPYTNALNYIGADCLVGEQVYSNAEGGFSASKMITFFEGNTPDDKKKEIENRLEKKFTGPKGKKFFLVFGITDPAKKPQIDDLGQSDLTKEDFEQVDNLISQNIFAGHQITSPTLFGIMETGKLGATKEMSESYQIFENTYAKDKRADLLEIVNLFAQIKQLNTLFEFEPLEDIVPATAEPQQMTNDVLRGLKGREYQQLMRLIRDFKKGKINRVQAETMLGTSYGLSVEEIQSILGDDQQFSSDDDVVQVFAEMGVPKSDYIIATSKNVRFESVLDAYMDEHEWSKQAFAEVSVSESNILDLIKKDKRITPQVIAKTLNTSTAWVEKKIAELTDRGVIAPRETLIGDDTVIERELTEPLSDMVDERPETAEISIKYSYEGPRDDRNRKFCAKLLELDRFYSRYEIEQISARLGYSVFDRRGGYWTRKGGDKTTPYCRHHWKSNVVVKKRK